MWRFAEELAATEAARNLDRVAERAAAENGYIKRSVDEGGSRSAGRPLTARALVDTGLAALFNSGDDIDRKLVRTEICAYLAGPPVPLYDYAILDADVEFRLRLDPPLSVVDGWELVTPSADDLTLLMGIPSAARFAPRKPFDLELHAGLLMLRRQTNDSRPAVGLYLYFDQRPAHHYWKPLLALNLYENSVLRAVAGFIVEPGRRADVRYDRVPIDIATHDGVDEYERVLVGEYELSAAELPPLAEFLGRLDALLAAIPAGKPARRLRLIADHFIRAGERAFGQGEVWDEDNADAVLHYVVALESILAGVDSEKSDLTRKVSQRAAVLVGKDDAEREEVAKIVRAAYSARSAYAHGSQPGNVELPSLRRIVRAVVLSRLIIGDTQSTPLHQLADRALLNKAILESQIRTPISDFWANVDAAKVPKLSRSD